ncbi:MAG: sensor histidine kinase [Pseudomonadota bacterium]|nr:sensor histidine kinase [Pseudomonadota bacterium]
MRLPEFIRENLEAILQEWENFARTIYPNAQQADALALRDHAQAMLTAIALDLDTAQGAQQSIEKSKGQAEAPRRESAAEIHAAGRLEAGFTIEQLIAEYRALRSSVLRLWSHQKGVASQVVLDDVVRFNEAIDQALTESVARFSRIVQQTQNLFLAILAHDVRTPIGAIGMGSQVLLRDETLPSRFLKVATRIQNSSKRVDEIVCDLLDFAITHTGENMPIVRAPVDLCALTETLVEEARTFHPDCAIVLTTSGRCEAELDAARIGQALSNLISNALQHGLPEAAVTVTLHGTDDEMVWTVHNFGTAISAANQKLIFDPARRYALRSDSGRSFGHKQNLGLGLHIAREIVKSHGGRIAVESQAESGTTFTVSLPRAADG